MYRGVVFAFLAVLFAGVISSAEAQQPGRWVLLGVRDVDLSLDKDTIDVKAAKGRFGAIRLVAKERGVEIFKVVINYYGGRKHTEDRRINLLPGERTRPIDPRRNGDFIDTIDLFYKTQGGTKVHAKVEVWGLLLIKGDEIAVRPTITKPAAPVATTPATPTSPAPQLGGNGDVLFGVQYVGFVRDRDVIKIGNEIGKFDKVRLRVLDNDVHLIQLKVVYSNGDPDVLAFDKPIKVGTRTPWFTLKGDRFIKEIEMVYRSRPNFKGEARVEVYGEYAEGWLANNGESQRFNQGWALLGAQTAAIRIGFERDVFQIARNPGGFKKIRIDVKDRAITLRQIKVTYGSGEDDIIPVQSVRVDAGKTFGPVDLKGGVRFIKQIELTYRSRFIDPSARGKGPAVVEVWAQR